MGALDGYLKRVNPAWERTLGWSDAELLSMPSGGLVHPEDLAAYTASVERLRQGEEVTHVDILSFPERDFQLLQQGDARGEWDGDRMAQLLTHLLTNAAKYSPVDTSITVSTRGGPLGVESWRSTMVERPSRPRCSRSVGLGLYIVKHIVDVHGGHVAVSSTEAGGTTFHVDLPRQPPLLPREERAC